MSSELFESKASDYESWYGSPRGQRAHESESKLLEWLLQPFPFASSVLEIGCGTGHFTRWLSPRSLRAVGLDRSPGMLAELQRISQGIPVVLGDAHRLPVRDSAFDLVLFVTTLEFLTDPEQAISEAVRAARQGVILVVLNKWSLSALGRRMARTRHPLLRHARDFSLTSLLAMAKRIGGTQVKAIRWRSSLYPNGLYRAVAPIPVGDVIGMALLLKKLPGPAG